MDRYAVFVTLIMFSMALHVAALCFDLQAIGADGQLSNMSLPRMRIAVGLTGTAIVPIVAMLILSRVGLAILLVSLVVLVIRYVVFRRIEMHLRH